MSFENNTLCIVFKGVYRKDYNGTKRDVFDMVVEERFELSVGYPTQPFQGCTIGHSDTRPY